MTALPSTPPLSVSELRNETYYKTVYPDYDRQNPPYKLRFYLDLLRRHVTPGSLIFELGVGQGRFLEAAAAVYRCAGCDINEYGVALTRERVPGAAVAVGSYEDISFGPALRALVAWDVLEHMTDLDAALEHLSGHLAEGAFLIGVVPVYDGPLGWLVHWLDKEPTHYFKLSRRAWIRQVQNHGWTVVESGGILRRLIFARWYLHLTRPQFLLWWLGSAFYFVARKEAKGYGWSRRRF